MSRPADRSPPGSERPANLAVLLREAFVALNDLVLARLAERGHGAVRPAHGAVFQYLDDTGTTVSLLAERAQMTKQAMAELVRHLETHGYVVRVPDPADRRPSWSCPPSAATRSSPSPRDWCPSSRHRISTVARRRPPPPCAAISRPSGLQ